MDASWWANMKIPPGFGFHPLEEGLIKDYLRPKIMGTNEPRVDIFIPTIDDLCKSNPSELPSLCRKPWSREYCYFFCKWKQYGKGARCDRKTKTGYWKKTCKESEITDSETGECIGIKSILVFYEGRNPGVKTKHIMHVCELKDGISRQSSTYVVCRLKIEKNKAKKTVNKVDQTGFGEQNHGWFSQPQDLFFFERGEPSSSVSVCTTPSETQQVHQGGSESLDSLGSMSIQELMDKFYIPMESSEGTLGCVLNFQEANSHDGMVSDLPPLDEGIWDLEMGYSLEGPQSSDDVDVNGGLCLSVHQLSGDFPKSS